MTVLGDETLPEAYWLPKILRDWTAKFARHGHVSPIAFDIKALKPSGPIKVTDQ